MRTTWILRAPASLAMAALLAGACSKAATPDNGGAGTGGGNGGGTGGTGGNTNGNTGTPPMKGTCDNPTLQILFTPMYSMYIDDNKRFKIPAVVNSIDPKAITWSADDPSYVDMEQDATSGGVMITTRKAGSVKIIASAGGLCGVSALTIAQASMDDWNIGSARYNDGVVLTRLPRGGTVTPDGGTNAREAACTNCHGDTATMGPFKTVSHTPEQTGGFSDQDLQNIITMAMVPMGGYFDEMVVTYDRWQSFHHWDMTPDQLRGIIVYLRSLTPQSQTGMRGDFGGGMRGDGGFMRGDGGFRRGDGGRNRGDGGGMMGGGAADAADTTEDSGSASD